MTATTGCAILIASGVLVTLLAILHARWLRRRAERQWADTCARCPWRVAAAREHPMLLVYPDDVLRLWWEREGRRYPSNADLVTAATTCAPARGRCGR